MIVRSCAAVKIHAYPDVVQQVAAGVTATSLALP
jgi:hypothetical protein